MWESTVSIIVETGTDWVTRHGTEREGGGRNCLFVFFTLIPELSELASFVWKYCDPYSSSSPCVRILLHRNHHYHLLMFENWHRQLLSWILLPLLLDLQIFPVLLLLSSVLGWASCPWKGEKNIPSQMRKVRKKQLETLTDTKICLRLRHTDKTGHRSEMSGSRVDKMSEGLAASSCRHNCSFFAASCPPHHPGNCWNGMPHLGLYILLSRV